MEKTQYDNFHDWWYNEGSRFVPHPDYDMYTHAFRMAELAWHECALSCMTACLSKKVFVDKVEENK
jgi:hypothetical protein